MKMLRNFMFICMLMVFLMPGVIFAQEQTPDVAETSVATEEAPVDPTVAVQVDESYSAFNRLVNGVVEAMPLIALVLSILTVSYLVLKGDVKSDGLGNELDMIRQTDIFSDAERSYERVKTPTSDMTINAAIAFLRATIMIPFLPRAMEDGLVGVVRLLEDLKDGPDGDEPVNKFTG